MGKAYQELGLSSATVAHSRNHFTPTTKLDKAKLGKTALRFLKGKSRAKVSSRSVTLVGGDQRCEALAGSMKRMPRRLGLLGKGRKTKSHIQGLSAVFLTEHVGIEPVLQAFACFRSACQDHMSPQQMWAHTDWAEDTTKRVCQGTWKRSRHFSSRLSANIIPNKLQKNRNPATKLEGSAKHFLERLWLGANSRNIALAKTFASRLSTLQSTWHNMRHTRPQPITHSKRQPYF